MADKYINSTGLQTIKDWVDTKVSGVSSLISGARTNLGTATENGYMRIKDGAHQGADAINIRYDFAESQNTINVEYETTGEWDKDRIFTIPTTSAVSFIAEYGTTSFSELAPIITENKRPIIVKKARLSDTLFLDVVINMATLGTNITLYGLCTDNSKSYSVTISVTSAASAWTCGAKELVPVATENIYGAVKLNPSESVTLNSNGQLDIGGRLGQMSDSTGIYSPKTISPAQVKNGSLLLTEASGTRLGNKSLAVTTGSGLTLRSAAAAGATQYLVNNTYENRIICAGLAGGTLALNESTAATNYTDITAVTLGGGSVTPDSSPDDSSKPIAIDVKTSINPNASTTSVRPYASSGNGFSNLVVGQQVGSQGGASLVVGQKCFSASGNANIIAGASMYNSGNGNALFGRQHISRKNRSFLAGTGHDTTNARSESVAAVGQWSNITSNTLFAVGNGTNHTTRLNAFEVLDDGSLVLRDSNGKRWKISVSTAGQLVVTAA